VRRHPEFETLESEKLERLKGILLKGIKCYGYVLRCVVTVMRGMLMESSFGAVVDQVLFETALFSTFIIKRVFEPSIS
jgi:hypothetical protein